MRLFFFIFFSKEQPFLIFMQNFIDANGCCYSYRKATMGSSFAALYAG